MLMLSDYAAAFLIAAQESSFGERNADVTRERPISSLTLTCIVFVFVGSAGAAAAAVWDNPSPARPAYMNPSQHGAPSRMGLDVGTHDQIASR